MIARRLLRVPLSSTCPGVSGLRMTTPMRTMASGSRARARRARFSNNLASAKAADDELRNPKGSATFQVLMRKMYVAVCTCARMCMYRCTSLSLPPLTLHTNPLPLSLSHLSTTHRYIKVHPDLLQNSHPEFSKVNDKSMQLLNGVLTSIKKYNEFPPRMVENIPFYLLDSSSGSTSLIALRIQTAGGECKKSLTASFAGFFTEAGVLPPLEEIRAAAESGDALAIARLKTPFVWDKEFFPTEERDYDDGEGDKEDSTVMHV